MAHDTDTDTDPDAPELSETEEAALHELQLGIEYVHRAYGNLLEFHHELGHAMDRIGDAEEELREAGHEEWADRLRDDHLPAGAISDRWTYELVEEFSDGFLEDADAFEEEVREELADGVGHVTERRQQRRIRERARTDDRRD
ncbi:hypothetical protein [Natronococcus sp. A-GB7]|uniref:hypothetical protein n=1 Tax=Natronococcus sp. A-GB7 TaxID=3037649 RepID=UPI00241E27E9|nr:hypothetical protein [Natronococcus sp. A-GB7]MDG5820883.1 hypothetical protein [Natronococcus sp. A-GB7]